MRPDLPGPLRRRGPRPLWLHLSGRSPLETPPSSPAGIDPALLAAVAAYRRHPYRRELADPPAIWAKADARLLEFARRGAPTVVVVPSLINRAYILDLLPERSMLRFLAQHGIRPLLFDWGWPGAEERRFGLADLIAERLEPALATLRRPVVLAGYCMGGLIALAAALRRPDRVRALALLATPWDFHAADRAEALRASDSLHTFEPLLTQTGTLPIDALQTLFSVIEPGAVAAKFRAFAELEQTSTAARNFVALEDWLNDGVPLAAPVAREVFTGWYRDNQPERGEWRIGGQKVIPETLRCPAFIAVPARDRIVPPESALALARRLHGAALVRPGSGHIGMIAGPRAQTALWQPLLDWLRGV